MVGVNAREKRLLLRKNLKNFHPLDFLFSHRRDEDKKVSKVTVEFFFEILFENIMTFCVGNFFELHCDGFFVRVFIKMNFSSSSFFRKKFYLFFFYPQRHKSSLSLIRAKHLYDYLILFEDIQCMYLDIKIQTTNLKLLNFILKKNLMNIIINCIEQSIIKSFLSFKKNSLRPIQCC